MTPVQEGFNLKGLNEIMKTKKIQSIAVTGVGGGVGQSIIKALQESQFKTIGLDGETLGAGLYAVPEAYKIPYANDPKFVDELIKICSKKKCQLLFPGLDIELQVLSENKEKFEKKGIVVVVSRPEVVEICDDKLKTYEFLKALNLPAPETFTLENFLKNRRLLSFPFILKPKKGGARSKNVFKIGKTSDLDRLLTIEKLDTRNYITQEYIEGDEYTCGTINLDGKHLGTIVMRRTLRDGDTYKCFTEKQPKIEALIKKIMKNLKPFGACNVQLRLKNGIPYVFEMNARCSGTTGARAMAGFNEPLNIANYLLLNKKPYFKVRMISILRYWKELVVENNMIVKVKKDGHILNRKYSFL